MNVVSWWRMRSWVWLIHEGSSNCYWKLGNLLLAQEEISISFDGISKWIIWRAVPDSSSISVKVLDEELKIEIPAQNGGRLCNMIPWPWWLGCLVSGDCSMIIHRDGMWRRLVRKLQPFEEHVPSIWWDVMPRYNAEGCSSRLING